MNIIINTDKNIKPDCLVNVPEVIVLTDIIDEKTYKEFKISFNKALQSGQKIIPIVIDSYGGNVHSCLGIVSIIKSSPVPVLTYVETKAMSCGAIISACGTKGLRFASPHSQFMLHECSSGSFGKIKDMEVSVDHSRHLNTTVFNILDQCAGKKKGFFEKVMRDNGNTDLFLTSKEVFNYRLIDNIAIPKIEINISTTFNVT